MCYYCVCPNTKLIVIVQISFCIFPNTKSFIFQDLLISYKCRKLSFADKLCRLLPLLSLDFRTCKFLLVVIVKPAICISKWWFYHICESCICVYCFMYLCLHVLSFLQILILILRGHEMVSKSIFLRNMYYWSIKKKVSGENCSKNCQ